MSEIAAGNEPDTSRGVGLLVESPVFPGDWDAVLAKARIADELGYDALWLGEAWGYELFTSLADLARVTSRIRLGAGVASIYSRSPAVLASAAATLDERSSGRMVLGLGASGPAVVEHWHGVPFRAPLQRTREYIEIIRTILRREPLHYSGTVFSLDRGFRLRFRPVRAEIPLYLAALGPRNIALAGELANGILPIYWPAHDYPALRGALDAGAAASDRAPGTCRIAPYITMELVEDEAEREAARRRARVPLAFYIGQMGTFYAEMLGRHGFASDVEAVRRGWERGQASAVRAVSDTLLDATAIVGTPAEVAARVRELKRLGVDEPILTIPGGTPDRVGALLDALARELARPR